MPDIEDEEIVVNTPKPKRKKVNIPVFSGKITNFSSNFNYYYLCMLDEDDEEVFINTPKSVKKKKVNIPAFKGITK